MIRSLRSSGLKYSQKISNFKPDDIILSGSRVQGNAHDESKLDTILVSETFRDIPRHERFPLVRKRIQTEQ